MHIVKSCLRWRYLKAAGNIWCIIALLFLFSACKDENSGMEDGEGVPLSLGSVSLTLDKTRATTLVTSGSIGVFMSGTGYTSQNDIEYAYSSGWSTLTPIYLYKKNASVCAYHPYSASITNSSAVVLTSQNYNAAADLSFAAAQTKTSASPGVSFTMTRAYSMLTFSITHEASYTGSCAISDISVSNSGILTGGSLNIATGVLSGKTAATVSFNPGITVASGSTASAQVLMVPVTTAMTGNITLSFTVDGVVKTATLSTSTLSTLAAGKNYTVNVTILQPGFKVTLANEAGTGNTIMAAEPANCYMLTPNGSITIPVDIKGNGDVASASLGSLSATHTAVTVDKYWETTAGLISVSFNSSTRMATVTATNASGNAVIAAYDTDGTTILWSWHIWVTGYDPYTRADSTNRWTNSAGVTNTFMDRNLGAIGTGYKNDANLLHYEFGRKDPFPAAAVKNKLGGSVSVTASTSSITLLNSINSPLIIVTSPATTWCSFSSDYWWMGIDGNTTIPGPKTIYDPCPAGWRVAAWRGGASPWDGLTATNKNTVNSCFVWTTPYNAGSYPLSGWRAGTSISGYIGTRAIYASASASSGAAIGLSITSSITSGTISPLNGANLRCVQEW